MNTTTTTNLTELVTKINSTHTEAQSGMRRSLEYYRDIGTWLIEAKAAVPANRKFTVWCKKNLDFSHHSACLYMRISRHWDQISSCETFSQAHRILSASDKKTPHVARNKGVQEWYTPPPYIDAAKKVMGKIDLDPASSKIAQQTVQAERFHTKEDNGLDKEWTGKIWCNPPYAANLVGKFAEKLLKHYNAGQITDAIILVNNATETSWFQGLAGRCTAICFPAKRVRFVDPEGKPGAPLQGQAVLYLEQDYDMFREYFGEFGIVFRRDDNARISVGGAGVCSGEDAAQ